MICAMCISPQQVNPGDVIVLDTHTSLTCGTLCSENHIQTWFPGVYTVQWSATVTADSSGEVIIQAFNKDTPVTGSMASETVSPGKYRTLAAAPIPIVFRSTEELVSVSLRNTGCMATISNVVLFLRKVY